MSRPIQTFYASYIQKQLFWWIGHSLPFTAPSVASHELPTFFDPVPNGAGRKRLWCTRVVCLFESDVLQPACQNCWFTITFAEEDQFWNGCHTSTNGLLFKHRALLHSYLSSQLSLSVWDPRFSVCLHSGYLYWWRCWPPLVGALG